MKVRATNPAPEQNPGGCATCGVGVPDPPAGGGTFMERWHWAMSQVSQPPMANPGIPVTVTNPEPAGYGMASQFRPKGKWADARPGTHPGRFGNPLAAASARPQPQGRGWSSRHRMRNGCDAGVGLALSATQAPTGPLQQANPIKFPCQWPHDDPRCKGTLHEAPRRRGAAPGAALLFPHIEGPSVGARRAVRRSRVAFNPALPCSIDNPCGNPQLCSLCIGGNRACEDPPRYWTEACKGGVGRFSSGGGSVPAPPTHGVGRAATRRTARRARAAFNPAPPLSAGRGGQLDYANQYAVFGPGVQPYGGYGGVGYAPSAPGVPVAYPVAPPGVYMQGQRCYSATDCAPGEYCHEGSCFPTPGEGRNVGVTKTTSIGGVPVGNPYHAPREQNPGTPITQITQSLAPPGFAVR